MVNTPGGVFLAMTDILKGAIFYIGRTFAFLTRTLPHDLTVASSVTNTLLKNINGLYFPKDVNISKNLNPQNIYSFIEAYINTFSRLHSLSV